MFLEKPNAKFERSLWIPLLSVFSEWFSTVLVELPHEEGADKVEGDNGVNSEHTQALLTYNTAFMVSLENRCRRGQARSGIEDSHF